MRSRDQRVVVQATGLPGIAKGEEPLGLLRSGRKERPPLKAAPIFGKAEIP